jgi:hypothetical protein
MQLEHARIIASGFKVSVWSVHTDDPWMGMVRVVLRAEGAWRDVVSPHPVHVHRESTGGLRLCVTVGAISVEVINVPPADLAGLDLHEHNKPVRLVTTQTWALVPREAP